MIYYKFLSEDESTILDVAEATSIRYICCNFAGEPQLEQTKTKRSCGVRVNNKLYNVLGFGGKFVSAIPSVYMIVSYKSEYERLKEQLTQTNTQIAQKLDVIDSELDYRKQLKIQELRSESQRAITQGIQLVENNKLVNYSLSIEDQLNILRLQFSLTDDAAVCMYHSDGNEIREYTKEEFLALVDCVNQHINEHTTRFNMLKHHVSRLKTISEVISVTYDQDIVENL